MRRRHHLRRRLQRAESLLGDAGDDIGGDRTARIGFVDCNQSARALHTFDHRVQIDRRERAQIDDFRFDPILGELVRRLQRAMHISP